MRSFAVLLTLGLAGSVMAAPARVPAPRASKDVMPLHRRLPHLANSVIDVLASSATTLSSKLTTLLPSTSTSEEDETDMVELDEEEAYYGTYGSYEDDVSEWEDRHAQCAEVCRVRTIQGASSGKEALCSADGLESTLACAQCIDLTWPEDLWENSAMAEYTRVALTCEAPSPESAQLSL